MIVYHICSISAALVLVIVIFIVGAYGTTDLNTCFIQSRTKGQLAEFIPIFINFPLMIISLIVSAKKIGKNFEPVIINLLCVVITLGIALGTATLISLLGAAKMLSSNIVDVGVTIGALSGFCVGLSRLMNKKLYVEVKNKLRGKKREVNINLHENIFSYEEASDDEYSIFDQSAFSLHRIFAQVTIKVPFIQTVSQILILVYFVIKTKEENVRSEVLIKNERITFNFDKDQYDLLKTQKKLRFIKHSKP